MAIYNISSTGFTFYVAADDHGDALSISTPLLGTFKRARVCDTSWVEGVLSVDPRSQNYELVDGKWEKIEGMVKRAPPFPPKECLDALTNGLVHVTGDQTTPDFEAPLTDRAVIAIGYGISRPSYMIYKKREPDAEIWTINRDRIPGADRHFEIHRAELLTPEMRAEVDSSDIDPESMTLYLHDTFPFNTIRRPWLNSTIDYILAMADRDGFSRIYLPGMDFGGIRDVEEIHSARYWIGVLEGKGAKVFLSPLSRAFECSIYCHSKEVGK